MALRHFITSLAIVAVTVTSALAQDNKDKDHEGNARPAQQTDRARPAPQARQNERAVPRAAEPQRQQPQRQPQQREQVQPQQIQRQQPLREVQPQQVQRQQPPREQVQRGDAAVRRDEAVRVPDHGVAVVLAPRRTARYCPGELPKVMACGRSLISMVSGTATIPAPHASPSKICR